MYDTEFFVANTVSDCSQSDSQKRQKQAKRGSKDVADDVAACLDDEDRTGYLEPHKHV